jgi:hypothetical protein
VGSGSRQILKALSTLICNAFQLVPSWRVGKVVSFFDGKKYSNSDYTAAVEVVFPNSSVQLICNKILLRDTSEISISPQGPPLWSRHAATLKQGEEVALYDVDPEIAAEAIARALGIESNAYITYQECKSALEDISKLSENREYNNIDSALEACGEEIKDKIMHYEDAHYKIMTLSEDEVNFRIFRVMSKKIKE